MKKHKFNKVVLWGYRLHTHTNSYVYSGFERAFKHMGYDTVWYFDDEDHSTENFDNCLFFAFSGQEDNIPLNTTSKYILHNAHLDRYIEAGCNFVMIQTLHDEAINKCNNITRINSYTLVDYSNSVTTIFTPWATNLLHTEFNFNLPLHREKRCVWIGTYGDFDGLYQNGQQLKPFFDRCDASDILLDFHDPWKNPVSFETNYKLVRESLLAPAIQGKWQIDNNYPPCRLFKNISYGNIGISNNKLANDIFDGGLLYDDDTEALFYKSIEYLSVDRRDEIKSQMMNVWNNHTYISRIKTIFDYL